MSGDPSSPSSPSRMSYDRRTPSFSGLLKRSTSKDLLGDRKTSSNNILNRAESGQEVPRQTTTNTVPPTLPGLPQQPELQTFGGENYNPTMATINSPPATAVTARSGNGVIDPYARTESMTHRGRHSYARSTNSTLNNQRRARRRKDPTPYK